MRLRDKLAFFGMGCAFVVAGQVAVMLLVPHALAEEDPLDQYLAQDATFRNLDVRRLRVLGDDGKVIGIFTGDGESLSHLVAGKLRANAMDTHSVNILDDSKDIRMILGVHPGGFFGERLLTAYGPGFVERVGINAGTEGASIEMTGGTDNRMVRLGADIAGSLFLYDHEGTARVWINPVSPDKPRMVLLSSAKSKRQTKESLESHE